MEFEWDAKKAASNRKKHAVSFELAITVTVRGKGATERCRLISARKASGKEKALYDINKRVPL